MISKALKAIFSLYVFALITGCAATGPSYVDAPLPKGTDALIHIYRPHNIMWSGRDAYFSVNDINIADLSSNGYTWFHVPAGDFSLKHRWPVDITYGMKDIVMPVKWAPDQKYYYRLDLWASGSSGMTKYEWRIVNVPEAQALQEIRNCKLQEPMGLQKLLGQVSR